MNLIAIDPGVKKCGYASFIDGRLFNAEWMPVDNLAKSLPNMLFLSICEMPRIYPGSAQQKGDLNDLLDLAVVAGRFVQLGASLVYPADWKAQVPKKVMTARILTFLTDEEKAKMVSKDHNTIDAIGIGLWKLGRMGRGGAKP